MGTWLPKLFDPGLSHDPRNVAVERYLAWKNREHGETAP